ncbi:hypothetical protein F8388_008470 [Cannabis sativa]|uniref:Uncharacterized protein n=1 Tax=Cannabis sativa TaxID=3483 RepID=A0A7J6EHU1_CANSA|nr:hypothetical protein F8388_008470 [Cannabis sativa]
MFHHFGIKSKEVGLEERMYNQLKGEAKSYFKNLVKPPQETILLVTDGLMAWSQEEMPLVTCQGKKRHTPIIKRQEGLLLMAFIHNIKLQERKGENLREHQASHGPQLREHRRDNTLSFVTTMLGQRQIILHLLNSNPNAYNMFKLPYAKPMENTYRITKYGAGLAN